MKLPWELTNNRILKTSIIILNTIPIMGAAIYSVIIFWLMIKQEPGSEYGLIFLVVLAIVLAATVLIINLIIIAGFSAYKRSRIFLLIYLIVLAAILFGGVNYIYNLNLKNEKHKKSIEISYSEASKLIKTCQLDVIAQTKIGIIRKHKEIWLSSYTKDVHRPVKYENGREQSQYQDLVHLAKANPQCGTIKELDNEIQIFRMNN